MTSTIIITLCILLLVAYLFTLTSAKTNIPSVLLLLVLGWGIRQATKLLNVQIPNLNPVLPVLATIGLILIVLEASLELRLSRNKMWLILKSFLGALIPMIILVTAMSLAFHHLLGYPIRNCIINAIPLCVISSAIAIPTAVNLEEHNKEFIIYESSLSDILGVLIFNFISLNEVYNGATFGNFGLQILLILAISFVATIGLSLLLSRIEHHVKFIPIILLVVMLYTILKVYHLPGLIFILLFGLFIGHLGKMKNLPLVRKIVRYEPEREVEMFTVLTIEGTFLIRSLFFLVFGYLLETSEVFDPTTALWSLAMVAAFFILRAIQLKLSKLDLNPLLWVAPRGLITILLFLYITPEQSIPLVNRSLIIQVIVLTVIVMAIGMMMRKEPEPENEKPSVEDPEEPGDTPLVPTP